MKYMELLSQGTSWWQASGVTPVAAYAPKGAADIAASYINLANPGTNNAATGVAPSFNASTGWTFNGSTTYLTTGLVPTSAWTMMVRFSSGSGTNTLAGSVATNADFYIKPSNSGGTAREYSYGDGALTTGAVVTSGTMAIAGANGYYNGALDNVISATFSGTAQDIYIGCRNSGDAANSIWTGAIQAVAIFNQTLNATQVAALHTAMAAI